MSRTVTEVAGQMLLWPDHAAAVETTVHRYEVEGQERVLTWEKHVCSCGTPNCMEPWK